MPTVVGDEMRNTEAGHPHQSEHVRLDDLALVLLLCIPDRVPSAREAGVVDEDVQASELLDCGGDERCTGDRVADVEWESDLGLEALGAAGAARDPRARLCQRLRRRRTDSTRRARHDRTLSRQGRCHRRNLPLNLVLTRFNG